MELNKDMLLKMYKSLFFIRRAEEAAEQLIKDGEKVVGTFHLGLGEEAIPVGTCFDLRKDDYVLPYLRGRGVFLMKGVPLKVIAAGWLGKEVGLDRARYHHHHLGDMKNGVIAGSGIVGADIAVSTGIALGLKLKKTDQVIVDYFGDGASNEGNFHEALNFAGAFKLPIIFVCRNNLYAVSMPFARASAEKDIALRAKGYGFPGVVVDGNDVISVYNATKEAINRARSGEGPTLIECKTYRWRGHNPKDPDLLRPNEEIESWKKKCPVRRFQEKLLEKGVLTKELLEEIECETKKEIEESIKWAKEAATPKEESINEDFKFIYK